MRGVFVSFLSLASNSSPGLRVLLLDLLRFLAFGFSLLVCNVLARTLALHFLNVLENSLLVLEFVAQL